MIKITKLLSDYFFPRLVLDLVTFYPLLMLAAVWATRLQPNISLLLGLIANYWLMVFAFVYNDIVDRADDANSGYVRHTIWQHLKSNLGFKQKLNGKRFLNPFSHGLLSVTQGYIVLFLVAIFAIIASYLAGGLPLFTVALVNLLVGIAYSHPVIRLKSRPVLDVISHALLLAALQVVYFMLYPQAVRDVVAFGLLGIAFALSVSGDLFNEYRDFEDDQSAGIRNLSTILGKATTLVIAQSLRYAVIVGVVLLLFVRY